MKRKEGKEERRAKEQDKVNLSDGSPFIKGAEMGLYEISV